MRFFEYRSDKVHVEEYGDGGDKLQKMCNEWGAQGWEVLSVICPDPRNYLTFRVTAKREITSQRTQSGRKFR